MFVSIKSIILMFVAVLLFVCNLVANSKIIVVGIIGGTGAGKIDFAKLIANSVGGNVSIISQSHYYNDFTYLTPEKREKINFDDPKTIDFELLAEHISTLKRGNTAERPQFDFINHTKNKKNVLVQPAPIIIISGSLLLAIPQIRKLLDIKIFLDVSCETRLLKRITKDVHTYGRTFEFVKKQYMSHVAPMYYKYIHNSKNYADIIINGGLQNKTGVNIVLAALNVYKLQNNNLLFNN